MASGARASPFYCPLRNRFGDQGLRPKHRQRIFSRWRFVETPNKKSYSYRMSVILEVIAAVVQGLTEAAVDLFLHRGSAHHADDS